MINALILLSCDESEFNEWRASGGVVAGVLRIRARRVDRVVHGGKLRIDFQQLPFQIYEAIERLER